ncbi:MAG: CRISPR-associated endonuclease Cas1 [Candidatus Dormibacteria bacterium]
MTDHRARVGVRDGSILVKAPDSGWERFPVEAVEAIVIVGRAQVTSDALALCAQKGVRVTGLSGGGRVRYTSGPGTGGNVLLRWRQYQVAQDETRSLALVRILVVGKLTNAEHLMRRWVADAPVSVRRSLSRLGSQIIEQAEKAAQAVTGDQARGCEGNGTRAYFEGLRLHLQQVRSDLSFLNRTRRPPRDEMNATMSFCYGLLLSDLKGALEGVGLDPQIGFLHKLRPGRPSLALDLLEEFRPSIVDRFVVGCIARRMLHDDSFVFAPGGACYLSDAGRKDLLVLWDRYRSEELAHPLLGRNVPRAALPILQSTLMARYLRGDLPQYAPYVGPR